MTLTRNLIIIISALVLAGCSFQREVFQSAELNSMLNQSEQFNQLETGHVVRNDYQDFHKSLGKPIPAEVRIEIEPTANHTTEDVLEEIIEIFENDGWEQREIRLPPPPDYWAYLPQDDFLIEAITSIQSDGNLVSIKFETVPQPSATDSASTNSSEH